MTYGDYRAMIEDSPVATRARRAARTPTRRILGACLVDLLDDGLSAVYSFYDPSDRKRSLGTFLILALIEEVRRRQRPMSIWATGSPRAPKMAYKARFRPLEGLGAQGWRPIDG